MVDIETPRFNQHRVVSIEEGAMVVRICLERISDGQFSVVHTEFDDPLSDPETFIEDVGTQVEDLNLTTQDEASWSFYPTLIDAISASQEVLADYSDWMKNARTY